MEKNYNKVSFELIGDLFMTYVKNVANPLTYNEFFELISSSMYDDLELVPYSDAELLNRISKNKTSISYVTGVNPSTCAFITEDSCHNIKGYNSLYELNTSSNVCLVLKKLGKNVFRGISEKEDTKYGKFLSYLMPFVKDILIHETIDYIGTDDGWFNDHRDWVAEVWHCNKVSDRDFLTSIEDMLDWENHTDYIEDVLCEVVLHEAQSNVYGVEQTLSCGEIQDICENINCETWVNTFKLWHNDTDAIKEKRIELGIYKEKDGISFKELKAKVEALGDNEWIDFFTNPNKDWIYTIGKGKIFNEDYIIVCPNTYACVEMVSFKDIRDMEYEDLTDMFSRHSEYDGNFYITDNYKDKS